LKLLLVILTPPHDGHLKTALNLSEAALRKGHGVIVFMTGDGALHAAQDMAESMALKMKQLVERGMQLVACRESLRQKGLHHEERLLEGVRISSLAEMVDLMDSSDKTLVFD